MMPVRLLRAAVAFLSPASPVIYEPFNDPDPTLNGNTPELGLTGTLSGQSLVADGSLIYGALAYQGGLAVTNPAKNHNSCWISPGTTLTGAGLSKH